MSNQAWQWARSTNRSSWTDISGATASSYTAAAEDAGHYLRARVEYTDLWGSGKSAEARLTGRIGETTPARNATPTFAEATTTRSIAQGTAAGRRIGEPLRATDPDDGDVLVYSLIGQDFAIDSSTGQLLTRSVLEYDPDGQNTYIVTVEVHDGFDFIYIPATFIDDSIEVTINVVARVVRPTPGPPPVVRGPGGPVNSTPVFQDAEGNAIIETMRAISEDAALGANVGEAVVAADPDEDTLTYTLGGDDAEFFAIDASTGQLTTATVLDHDVKPSHVVTVTAADPSGATAEIRVTITVTALSFDCTSGDAVADAAGNPGLVADCEALLESRHRLARDATLNWSEDTPITEWDGVTVGGSPQRVTRLRLERMGLNGTIPADLSRLSSLEGLYLNNNELAGPIPPQLGELSNLVHLTLHRNRLDGEIASELGDMTSLLFLSLYGNKLTGEIPGELGSLANLRWLYLHSNKSRDNDGLSGEVPSALGDLSSLERLFLYGNSLSGTIPAELGRLSNLKSLLLHDNELTGQIPVELGNLSRLRYLWLDDNDLSGAIPPQLSNLSNLRWLSLYRNDLSGAIPAELGDLSGLRLLILDGNDLSGAIPARLGELSELTWLDLNDNDLSGPIPGALGDLYNLEHLYLHNNALSSSVPPDLGRLSKLTNLWLRGNRLSGQIPPSLGDLPNLQRIRIGGNAFTGCVPAGLLGGPRWYSDAGELGLPVCENGDGS